MIIIDDWDDIEKIGEHAVERLIAALDDNNFNTRCYSSQTLARIGDHRAIDALINALKTKGPNHSCRSWFARALGTFGDIRAVEVLIDIMKHESGYGGVVHTRTSAAAALGRIGDPRAIEPLIEMLKDRAWELKRASASALGELGDSRAIEPLLKALKRKKIHKETKKIMIEALGKINNSRAVEALINVMKERPLRVTAMATLGKVGDKSAITPILAYLDIDTHGYRRSAARALKNLGWEPKNKYEEVAYLIALEKWKELVSVGMPAVKQLIFMLDDPNLSTILNVNKTLKKITKEDFGHDQEKWQSWWEENKEKYINEKPK